MAAQAPRYDPRIATFLRALDDRARPMAETCRLVAAVAESIGLTRPSYVHMRRYILAERARQDEARERREALRTIAGDVAADLVLHRAVDAYEVAARVQRARSGRSA